MSSLFPVHSHSIHSYFLQIQMSAYMAHIIVMNMLPAPTHQEVIHAYVMMDFLVMAQTHVQVSKSVPK